VEIEDGVGLGQCKLKKEDEGIDAIEPKCWGLFEGMKCFLQLNDDCWCVEAFWPTPGQGHIDIILIVFWIKKCHTYIQMIDISATFSDKTEEV